MPQEGHSVLLEVPYEEWDINRPDGIYEANEKTIHEMIEQGRPHIAETLELYMEALYDWSCTKTDESLYRECVLLDTGIYSNGVKEDVLVDPHADHCCETSARKHVLNYCGN